MKLTRDEKRAIHKAAWAESRGAAERRTMYENIVARLLAERGAQPVVRPSAVAPAAPAPKSEPRPYTKAPVAWRGQVLFDWGQKGLRSVQCVKIRGDEDNRDRKTFNLDWFHVGDEARITAGEKPQLVRAVKALTREIWPVRVRKGRFWKVAYYLTSAQAVRDASATMPEMPAQTTAAEDGAAIAAEAFGVNASPEYAGELLEDAAAPF